jgi:hypothetical protein
MNLYETTAFMLMLKPYVSGLVDRFDSSPIDLLQGFLRDVTSRFPEDIVRFLAMLYHVDAQTFTDDKGIKPAELISALVDGFNENRLPDIIQSGVALGIYDRGLNVITSGRSGR